MDTSFHTIQYAFRTITTAPSPPHHHPSACRCLSAEGNDEIHLYPFSMFCHAELPVTYHLPGRRRPQPQQLVMPRRYSSHRSRSCYSRCNRWRRPQMWWRRRGRGEDTCCVRRQLRGRVREGKTSLRKIGWLMGLWGKRAREGSIIDTLLVCWPGCLCLRVSAKQRRRHTGA